MDTHTRSHAAALVAEAITSIKANRKRITVGLAAVLIAGGAYAYNERAKAAARRARKPAGGAPKTPLKRSPQASLHSVITYLLPLAGRKVAVLVALALLRTALSNRLARLQVCFLLLLSSTHTYGFLSMSARILFVNVCL